MCKVDIHEYETREKMIDAMNKANVGNGIVFFDFREFSEAGIDGHQIRFLCHLIAAAAHQVHVTDSVIDQLFEHQYVCPGSATRRHDIIIPMIGLSENIVKSIIATINDYNLLGCMSIEQYTR